MNMSTMVTPKNQKSQAKVEIDKEGITDYLSTNDIAKSEANQ